MKKSLVVDASVAIKWFLPEIHSEKSSLILESKLELLAPDLIWIEFGSALRKKVRLKEVTVQKAESILEKFMQFPIQTYGSKLLLNSAWHLAHETGATVYDSLYLALANSCSCSVVTADNKFYGSVSKGKGGLRIIWIENFHY